jgi:hypothetical protein
MITLADQLREARRELALRKVVYPGQVKRGTMTEGQAAYHLAAQEAIIATLARLDPEQRELPLFRTYSNPDAVWGMKQLPCDYANAPAGLALAGCS